jgi:hypothetical protein
MPLVILGAGKVVCDSARAWHWAPCSSECDSIHQDNAVPKRGRIIRAGAILYGAPGEGAQLPREKIIASNLSRHDIIAMFKVLFPVMCACLQTFALIKLRKSASTSR